MEGWLARLGWCWVAIAALTLSGCGKELGRAEPSQPGDTAEVTLTLAAGDSVNIWHDIDYRKATRAGNCSGDCSRCLTWEIDIVQDLKVVEHMSCPATYFSGPCKGGRNQHGQDHAWTNCKVSNCATELKQGGKTTVRGKLQISCPEYQVDRHAFRVVQR